MSEIIISGTIRIHPDDRDVAIGAAADAIAGARAQDGCIAYAFVPDNIEDDAIVVYEHWADQDALAAHLAGPWYRATGEVLRSHRLQGTDVLKHRIERSQAVYDDDRVPRADFWDE